MSKDIKIELVYGCEGDCLVMNDYRIAGPKPWGGGRTKQTFYTTEGDILTAYKFKELAKLKQQLTIAVEALEEYGNCKNWFNTYDSESADFEPLYWANKWKNEFGYKYAQEKLKQIEELDK